MSYFSLHRHMYIFPPGERAGSRPCTTIIIPSPNCKAPNPLLSLLVPISKHQGTCHHISLPARLGRNNSVTNSLSHYYTLRSRAPPPSIVLVGLRLFSATMGADTVTWGRINNPILRSTRKATSLDACKQDWPGPGI